MKCIWLMMAAALAMAMAFTAQAEKTAKAVVENDGKTLRFVYDTANATNMNLMFGSCWALASLDVTGFDTSKVTDMYDMFG